MISLSVNHFYFLMSCWDFECETIMCFLAHFSCSAHISMVIQVYFSQSSWWDLCDIKSNWINFCNQWIFMIFYLIHNHFYPLLPSFLSQGNVTFSCAEPVSVSVTFTDSQSFLQLPGLTSWASGVVSVTLQFRTWNKAGLLLTFDLWQQEGTVWLYLSEARLRLQIIKAGRAQLELSAGQPWFCSYTFWVWICWLCCFLHYREVWKCSYSSVLYLRLETPTDLFCLSTKTTNWKSVFMCLMCGRAFTLRWTELSFCEVFALVQNVWNSGENFKHKLNQNLWDESCSVNAYNRNKHVWSLKLIYPFNRSSNCMGNEFLYNSLL